MHWPQKMTDWRKLLREFPGRLLAYPFRRRRGRSPKPPTKPYVHAAPQSFNFRYNDGDRLPLTRAPSLNHVTASTPQACFNILPLEIRLQIWEDVLGGHTIHLCLEWDYKPEPTYEDWDPNPQKLRLLGNQCSDQDPSSYKSYDEGCRQKCRTAAALARHKLLSLLLVCKQLYREGIDLLYSSNTFFITDYDSDTRLLLLPSILLPQRLNTIRSLRVSLNLFDPPPILPPPDLSDERINQGIMNRKIKWGKKWSIISDMQSLKSLEVGLDVSFFWTTLNKESAEQLLAPIKRVTKPEKFVLSLPFPAKVKGMAPVDSFPSGAKKGWEGSDPWDDLNCIIRRTN